MSSKPNKPLWRDFFGEKRREGLTPQEISALWHQQKEDAQQSSIDKRKERVNRAKEFFQKHNKQETQPEEPSPAPTKPPAKAQAQAQEQPQQPEDSDSEPEIVPAQKPVVERSVQRKNMKDRLEAQSKVTESLTKRAQQLPIDDSSDDESVRVNLKTLKSLIKHRR